METIKLNNVTPSPGDTVSVPVLIEYGTEAGALLTGDPTEISCTAWNEQGDQSPIARGTRAHLFVAPPRVKRTNNGMEFEFPGESRLEILDTISQIKSDGLPLTEWVSKLGNAYCYDYSNPYTRGCLVGLTNDTGTTISNRFKFTRIDFTGRIDAYYYQNNGHEPWFYAIPGTAYTGSDWVQDGFDKNNMYSGYHKDVNSGTITRYDINKIKSALDIQDVETHTVECYRGLRFENDYYDEPCASDILVIVDWDDTMEYTVFDEWNAQTGFPTSKTVTGPKAFFAIAWDGDGGSFETRLQVSDDPGEIIDIYPAAPAEEFEFTPLGGGGGGSGNNGKGGRAVSSSIPMRITSSGNIDYRHFLDLYDETNYNERNMFLTNYVGRIPYKLVEYDSSESGGTGVIRVATELQFTHFVGASFTDANVPRVYEVLSHKSMGGSPNVLLCTFRVCHLKDFFQHFGVTSETEFLVQRSTYSGLYNPWLKDARILSEAVDEEGWSYGSGGFNFGQNSALITLTSGEAIILPLTSAAPGYSYTEPMYPGYDHAWFYQINSLSGLINCAEDVDSDPKSSLYSSAFVNALLSKIKNVYMVSSQMVASIGSSGFVQVKCDLSYSTDPDDPEGTLYTQIAIASLHGVVVSNPEWPKSYTADFLGAGSFTDWTDLDATYQMMIPWYGTAEISGVELKRIIDAGSGSIGVQYLVSCLDGTISIAIGGSSGKIIRSWKSLPKIAIPASSRTLSYKQTNEQIVKEAAVRNDSTLLSSIVSVGGGLIGGAAALAMGNPIAAGIAVGGGIAGAVSANISNDLRDRSAAIGSEIAKTNITFNATSCDGYEILSIQQMIIVKVKKHEVLNVYNVIGYPCSALWRSVGAVNGHKYWVSILGNIKGTAAYAQAVRGEIERDGIIYNYS